MPRLVFSRSTRLITLRRIVATTPTLTSLSSSAPHTCLSTALRASSSMVRFLLSSLSAEVSLLPSSVSTMAAAARACELGRLQEVLAVR